MKMPTGDKMKKSLLAINQSIAESLPYMVAVLETMASPFSEGETNSMVESIGIPTYGSGIALSPNTIKNSKKFPDLINSFVDSIAKVNTGSMKKAASSTRKIKKNAQIIATNLKAASKALLNSGKLKADVTGGLNSLSADVMAFNEAITEANKQSAMNFHANITVNMRASDTAYAIMNSKYMISVRNNTSAGQHNEEYRTNTTGVKLQ